MRGRVLESLSSPLTHLYTINIIVYMYYIFINILVWWQAQEFHYISTFAWLLYLTFLSKEKMFIFFYCFAHTVHNVIILFVEGAIFIFEYRIYRLTTISGLLLLRCPTKYWLEHTWFSVTLDDWRLSPVLYKARKWSS